MVKSVSWIAGIQQLIVNLPHASDAHSLKSEVRLIKNKIPKDWLLQPPSGPLVQLKHSSGGPVPHCFMMPQTSLLLFSNHIQTSGQHQTHMLTSAPRLQGHHVLAEVSWHIYCRLLLHKLVAWRERPCLADYEVWNFFKEAEPTLKRPTKHPQPPNHRPLRTPSLSEFLILLLFCCNFFSLFFFFFSLINWSWSQEKSTSYCPLYGLSSHDKKWQLFLR